MILDEKRHSCGPANWVNTANNTRRFQATIGVSHQTGLLPADQDECRMTAFAADCGPRRRTAGDPSVDFQRSSGTCHPGRQSFVIRVMTPSTPAAKCLVRSLLFASAGCVISLPAQESSGLAPFLVAVSARNAPEVEASANKALAAPIASIVDKPQPSPTGDAHDYVSYARYYWPNPDTPSHLPYVRRDGHSNTEQVNRGDEPRLIAMQDNVDSLALGWAVLHREDYARRAVDWLRVWLIDPATVMHPNLDRGQIALGHDANRGRAEGILDARGFIGLVDALRMLHGSLALTDADESAIHLWMGQYLQWMLGSKIGHAEHSAANNHGSWFLAQAIAIARYVGRDDIAVGLANEDFARIASQIEPDGRQPLELVRADGLGYSIFNLKAQFIVVRLAAGLGVDLANYQAPTGASLGKAVDYLAPYNMAPSKWPGNQAAKIEPGFLDEILAQEKLAAADIQPKK
jgi:alginate lyase